MTLLVSVIILSYNNLDLTLNCLSSINQQSYQNIEIIVIDNASQDNTVNAVSSTFSEVNIFPLKTNLGYAGGNNFGIKEALEVNPDIIFLLNNDTYLDKHCISILISSLVNNPNIGIIGPMIYTWDNWSTISSAGGKIDWRNADAVNMGAGQMDEGQYAARDVDFVNGCGLMVTKSAIKAAGLLDESYFMYWEETDWCQRIRKAGYSARFEPNAQMQHKAPIKSSEIGLTSSYYMTRNRFKFFARHTPNSQKPGTLLHAFHGTIRGIYQNKKLGYTDQANVMQLALKHALLQRWGRVL
jgi:GT2 family glycosyltransferase